MDYMSKEEVDKKGITVKKAEDISEWYSEVVQKAELADYSPVKGFVVFRPNAYSIWEFIQNYFNGVLKKQKVDNAYFPLLIPESFFKREAEHAEGFAPELAYIENESEEGERLALRPTSETIMYDSYSKWIRSWRDLPLKINQWCNIVRWEVSQTKPFLRSREFLWQEGHCVFENEKDAIKDMQKMIKEYQKMLEKLLAIPSIIGEKSEMEKFPGAVTTMTIEAMMPDGKALQCGTSHNLGQGFAKTFDVTFKDKDEKDALAWQTSWGFSTRLIGALIMSHGDDKGLVLPPKVAKNKIVLVPILFEDSKKKVLDKAKEIESKLRKFGAFVDNREEYKPGFKFNEWEMKGIPIRIEIGPKDIVSRQVIAVRRDTGEKETIKLTGLDKRIPKLLDEIQNSLYEKAKKNLYDNIVEADSLADLKKKISEGKLVRVYMEDKKKVEEELKEKTGGANSRFIETAKVEGKCLISGNKTKTVAYVARSY